MSIGFLPNNVPFVVKKVDKSAADDDLDFDGIWDRALDRNSVEARDAYAQYDRSLRRN